ncbi:hypothetical protein ACQBAU_13310 [Propionibacteriaceae bacterium Y2011]
MLAFVNLRGLGLGDVKLGALLGVTLGWPAAVGGLLAAFVLNGVVIVIMVAARRTDPAGEVPFGPALVAGAALAVVVHLLS